MGETWCEIHEFGGFISDEGCPACARDHLAAENAALRAEAAECGRIAGEALGTEEALRDPATGVVQALATWARQLCEDKDVLREKLAAAEGCRLTVLARLGDREPTDDNSDPDDTLTGVVAELLTRYNRAEAAMQWRSMESAPKDGTWIVLWQPYTPMCVRWWWLTEQGGWIDHTGRLVGEALYWMPLPPAPGGER